MRTIEPCCSSAVHHAWRLHSRLHLGRKCRLEKVALVVRRSEAAGWRWSSSTLNECKPRFLGVAVMHWARPMAAELRDSRSERRQGSSSDISSVREKARIALLRRKGSSHLARPLKAKSRRPLGSRDLFTDGVGRLRDLRRPTNAFSGPTTGLGRATQAVPAPRWRGSCPGDDMMDQRYRAASTVASPCRP